MNLSRDEKLEQLERILQSQVLHGSESLRAFLRFVSDVFRHRRKQLRSALGHEAGIDRERAERALQETGIDPRRLAEELSVAQWVALATALGVPRE